MRRSATGSVLLPGIETSVTSNVVAPEYRLTLSPKIESDSGATAWAARMRCAYSSYASTPLYWANAKHGNSSAHAASQLATSFVLPPRKTSGERYPTCCKEWVKPTQPTNGRVVLRTTGPSVGANKWAGRSISGPATSRPNDRSNHIETLLERRRRSRHRTFAQKPPVCAPGP